MIRALLLLALLAPALWPQPAPVIRTGVPFATRDKPQSKLWFAHGTWWAWLPVPEGSAVWRRDNSGWIRQTHLDAPLRGLPGQADVWSDDTGAAAVLSSPRELAFVSLRWSGTRYEPALAPIRWTLAGGPAETATLARDGGRLWWIAWNQDRRMFLRASHDPAGLAWAAPAAVNPHEAADDDLCAVATLPGGIGVLWSDQAHDAVYFRRPGGPIETVAEGGKTADDHINTATGRDGTLYAAMKNSVDLPGEPQLVLRLRTPDGRWSSHPYAPLTAEGGPSRPIVLLTPPPERLLLLHSVYAPRTPGAAHNYIAGLAATPSQLSPATPHQSLLRLPAAALNDVTGSKAPLPPGAPWIALASTQDGSVYEIPLSPLTGQK